MLRVINLIGELWFRVWMPGFLAIAMYQSIACHNLVCGVI